VHGGTVIGRAGRRDLPHAVRRLGDAGLAGGFAEGVAKRLLLQRSTVLAADESEVPVGPALSVRSRIG
jgi:hypothetical protein